MNNIPRDKIHLSLNLQIFNFSLTSIDLQTALISLIVFKSPFKSLFTVDLIKVDWKKASTFNSFWPGMAGRLCDVYDNW